MVKRIASRSWLSIVESLTGAVGLVAMALLDLRVNRLLPSWLDVVLLLGTIWVVVIVLVAAGRKLARPE